MSVRALPMLVLSLIAYNALVFTGGVETLDSVLFRVAMPIDGVWRMTVGDVLLVFSIGMLGIEVVKATYTRGSGLADQALSMILFVVFMVEFLLVGNSATSVFFLITLMSLIDVIAGAIIGIRTARRDFGLGTDIG